MQYFAIGEDNGGAGERRLGPFDTAEEAQAAGQRETKDSNGGFVFRGVVDEANNQVLTAGDVTALNAKISNSVRTSCPVVANAIAANRRVVRNAMTVEEQRAFQKDKLPKIEAEVAKFVKDCDAIYSQVKAACAKADGVASALTGLDGKAKTLKFPDSYEVAEYDKSVWKRLYMEADKANKKLTDCRDMVTKLGYGIVNAFRTTAGSTFD